MDVVITLGGDGIVNEVVNGLLDDGPGPNVPMLATIPGGSGNVFARALGLPNDPVEASGEILEALRENRFKDIGLGRVIGTDISRWFIANAGLGLDAEIIDSMERQRQSGQSATPTRYMATAIREYLVHTDRKHAPLTLHTKNDDPVSGVFFAIIQNVAPWTYFGAWPLDPCPQASFDSGLDVMALRGLRAGSVVRALRQMMLKTWPSGAGARDNVIHDLPELSISADRPTPMQIDGEFAGHVTEIRFVSVPRALRAVCYH